MILLSLLLAFGGLIRSSGGDPTVAGALRHVAMVRLPAHPLPVERTVAEALLRYAAPGAQIDSAENIARSVAGTLSVRVDRRAADESAGQFTFRMLPDGSGELTASHAHILYAAFRRVVDDWGGDGVAAYAPGRSGSFRLGWLEGNDGLFAGPPRFIRNYDPGETIREMARLGCSHVSVNVLAATAAAEEGVPGEIYPRFYAYSPDLDQFVESPLTKGLYPPEYLEANLALLKKNAALAVAYGLTPGLTICSPRTMPEAFFTRYPWLRGARVDHPFRSYRPRYTATLSHPLVRWHYAELMKAIMREVPSLGYLTLWTNDSGSGFEYVSTLYAGRNGGAYLIREWKSDSAIAQAAGENVVRYLRLLRDAASDTNPGFRVIMSLSWFGAEKDVIRGGLGDRLDLQVQPSDTAELSRDHGGARGPRLFGTVSTGANFIVGAPDPWLTLEQLRGVAGSPLTNFSVVFDPPSLSPWSINREVIRAFQSQSLSPADSIVQQVARRWCGAEKAPGLVRAWRLADSAIRVFPEVPLYENGWAFPWYRHWVRPFVPDIGAIPPEERAYYEKNMIATFNNPTLVDFAADALWLLMTREQAASIVRTCDGRVWEKLDTAIRLLGDLEKEGGEGVRVLSDQRDRLIALRCFFRTLRNIAEWVDGVHGYIDARSAPERERMLRKVRAMVDDELANTEALRALWVRAHAEFMPLAQTGENWGLYGTNFGDLLLKKIALMKAHRNDIPRVDPDFMWRAAPGTPVDSSDYLRY